MLIPNSSAELIDKITILRLKQQHLQRENALANVAKELHVLESVLDEIA